MPQSTNHTPAWADFAHAAIKHLRRHHGVGDPASEDTDETDPPSELDELFARFDAGRETEQFGPVTHLPSRYIPARQLLTVIRLAAAFGGSAAYNESRLCSALTVISDIAPSDISTVKEALKHGFPHSDWQIIVPDITDGKPAKGAQDRFDAAITERIDRIEPCLILQSHGISLPRHLLAIGPAVLPLAPVSRCILMTYLLAGHLHDQIPDPDALRRALPADTELAEFETLDICAALRAPTPRMILHRLDSIISATAKAMGPRLDDFGGDTPVLSTARSIVDDLQQWKSGRVDWDKISHSLLLYGPPGTGKTWLARAIGNSAGIASVDASFAGWQAEGHLGDMLRAMSFSFSEARRLAPCVLIIDEIDAVGSRSDSDRHGSNYRGQVINAFLGHMDSISKDPGVVVIGTCNDLGRIDPAVLRGGRMDIKINVPMPDAETLLAILRHHLREDIADHELKSLSHRAVGRSAADIDAAIRAARSDARHAKKRLSLQMLQTQLRIETSAADTAVLWRIALHEAGHAVVGTALDIGKIENIAITTDGGQIQRRRVPNESLIADIEAEIVYSLAGRAAERLVLGEVSAGAGGSAASDLALATRCAVDVETILGLGYEGLVWQAQPDAVHLQTPAIRDRVRQRLNRAEQRAGAILTQHRGTLETLASTLVQKRSMRAQEIADLLRGITGCDGAVPPNIDLQILIENQPRAV